MYILVSFVTSHFGQMQARWHNMPAGGRVEGAPGLVDRSREGVLALFDSESTARSPVWHVALESPAGFAVMKDQRICYASMMGNRVSTLDSNLKVVDSFSTPDCNDLHSVSLTKRGILVTSSGTDMIIEFSPDGVPLWSWAASDHGYGDVEDSRGATHTDARLVQIATPSQLTHINSALESAIGPREVILATLFHQGQLVAIDRVSGDVDVLVRGMDRPHAIRPRPNGGWTLCASGNSAVVLLDSGFKIEGIIDGDFDWVQDALDVDGETMLIADANHNRVVSWSNSQSMASELLSYSDDWKIYQVEIVDPRTSRWLIGQDADAAIS